VVFATSRRRVLGTWDRFHIALPFGRGVFLWGEAIEVGRDVDEASLEHARLRVEDRLNSLAAEADRRVGHGLNSLAAARGPADLSAGLAPSEHR
jgi:hypothetical protein